MILKFSFTQHARLGEEGRSCSLCPSYASFHISQLASEDSAVHLNWRAGPGRDRLRRTGAGAGRIEPEFVFLGKTPAALICAAN